MSMTSVLSPLTVNSSQFFLKAGNDICETEALSMTLFIIMGRRTFVAWTVVPDDKVQVKVAEGIEVKLAANSMAITTT